jgi:ferritin
MIKSKVLISLNKQLNQEFYASYEYLGMAAFFESENLSGFAHWMRMQSQEEHTHAMKIFNYILNVDSKVKLTAIKEPKYDWKTASEVFQATYKHEQSVTKSIYDLVDLCIAEKDHATHNFLQWFVSEQVEEESSALKILEKIKMAGDNRGALFLLDREMAQRALQ